MVKLYFNDNLPLVNINWTIYKGQSSVKEDFDRATIWMWLVTDKNRIPLDAIAENGTIKAVIPPTLSPDSYSLKAIWVKKGTYNFCKQAIDNGKQLGIETRVISEVQNAFLVVDREEDATEFEGDNYTLCFKSSVATYGYDGLDAYEKSVIAGYTKLDEDSWLRSRGITGLVQQTGNSESEAMSQKAVTESINGLQSQIDRLIDESILVNFKSFPERIFINELTPVNIIVSFSGVANYITLRKGDEIISHIENIKDFSKVMYLSETTTFTLEARIQGIDIIRDLEVSAVHHIYYGGGSNFDNFLTKAMKHMIPMVSPQGIYSIQIDTKGDKVFFAVPDGMEINGAQLVYDGLGGLPLKDPVVNQIDNVNYKVYESENEYDLSTINLQIL